MRRLFVSHVAQSFELCLISRAFRNRVTSTRCPTGKMAVAQHSTTVKPPNVLVLQPSGTKQDNSHFGHLREELSSCLNPERYVIYPLGMEEVLKVPWKENCSLLFVPSGIEASSIVYKEILSFVMNGGILLSIEGMLNSMLGFRMQIELKENQLCSLVPAPGSSDERDRLQALAIATSDHSINDVLPEEAVVLREILAFLTDIQDVWVPSADTKIPCVQKCTLKAKGQALLSYVNLVPSPDPCSSLNIATLMQLKSGGEGRGSFLRAVLGGMGLECSSEGVPHLSHTYLICSDKNRSQFLSVFGKEDRIKGSEMDIELIPDDMTEGTPVDPPPEPAHNSISIYTKPAKWQLTSLPFNPDLYFSHLRTTHLGKTMLYTSVISSTQTVFTGNIPFCTSLSSEMGLVCVATQQTKGKGRHGNVWISPKGSMMFSTALKFPPWSKLYQRMPLLQHIVALAVVSAIRTIPGYQDVAICIKWPNDIYYKDQVKLGGILVSCFSIGTETTLTAVIGCGVNISNKYPTMSVNDCIALHNSQTGSSLSLLDIEHVLALTFNKLEMYLKQYDAIEMKSIEELYYKYWLHSGATVKLASHNNEDVTILGIDEYGYLRVKCHSGKELLLQPDGNTFDIMKGLIAMK